MRHRLPALLLLVGLFALTLVLSYCSPKESASNQTPIVDAGAGKGVDELSDAGSWDSGNGVGVETRDAGRSLERCSAGPCTDGGYCHPTFKVCLLSCASGCPPTSIRCVTDTGARTSGDAGYCQCIADQLCDREVPGDICQTHTRACGPRCGVDEPCPAGCTWIA